MASRTNLNEWLTLQKKIFTRWVNQKLNVANLPAITDFVTDVSKEPKILIQLLETLSEKKFAGKLNNGKMRVMLIDNAGEAIKFATGPCGVVLKPAPSAEDVVDGNVKNMLGMLWNIMMKYMKFEGDEGEATLNAKDSLLMWCKNKTQGYKNVQVDNLTTSFHDGIALCALIHKHRPKMIPLMERLVPEKKRDNIIMAMQAAEKYFGLEQYITPEELVKLDENSMTVYISEYYYGIAEQRKVDLASRRINKVVTFTKQNDAAKLTYNDEALKNVAHMKKVGELLGDRTIDNNMAGAKKRIEDFYVYKTKDKNEILQSQLTLEAVYNNLSMVLAQHKRPEYVPPAGCSLKDVESSVAELERCEVERKVALHAELNRQINLVRMDEQHKTQFEKYVAWSEEKKAYLLTKEQVDSVGVAIYQIACLDAYDADAKGVKETQIPDLVSQATIMQNEIYENIERVNERVQKVNETFEELCKLSAEKRPVLLDDLAREEFKEKIRLENENSQSIYKKISAWVAEKEAYLNVKEEVNSVTIAQECLAILEGYEQDKNNMNDAYVAMLKAINSKILSSVYETQYSSWKFETPDDIVARDSAIDQSWITLSELSTHKLAILRDDLARETYAAETRVLNRSHVDRFDRLLSWVNEKKEYLQTREVIETVSQAQTQISLVETYQNENEAMTKSSLASLKTLGETILIRKYETTYSSYVFENPTEIQERLSTMDQQWTELADLTQQKKVFLDGELKREQEKEKLRLEFASLCNNMIRWYKQTKDKTEGTHFGFTLEEVQAFQQILEQENQTINAKADEQIACANDIFTKGVELGVKENIYTTESPDGLQAMRTEVLTKLEERNNRFQVELARQIANDNLCKEFANVADPFAKSITDEKDKITHARETLEEQLKYVDAKLGDLGSFKATMETIKEVSGRMDAAEITNNRHTTLTAKEAEVLLEQFILFLEKKKGMLEQEIEHEKLRGLTVEQMAEIDANFLEFDTNKDDELSKKELKALLYSLGEEKSPSEVDHIMKTYGNGTILKKNEFKEYMINYIGDSDTKEEVVNSFKLINKSDILIKEKMDMVMKEEDVAFILKTAPAVQGGHNYNAWIDEVFSR